MNLAHRLESKATPGRILVAEAEGKELAVKGRAQTVVAYECRPA